MALHDQVVAQMLKHDHMSQWLGIEIDVLGIGYCKLHFTIRKEMLNGFGIVHGGIVFSAADSAFAFACNSHGRLSLALDAHINFVKGAAEGDILHVLAEETHLGYKTGVYRVTVTNEDGDLVATFTGTSYRTSKNVLEESADDNVNKQAG